MFRKNKLAMLVGEFLGTAALTLVVLNIKNSQANIAVFIAAGAGLTIALMTLALAGISGAVFNPAMTIGLWTVRKLRSLQALTYLAVQVLGGATAWWVFTYLIKLHQHVPNYGKYDSHLLVAEAIGTFVFAFAWAAAIYQRFSLYAKALTIGAGYVAGSLIVSLVAVTTTTSIVSAGVLNPAMALGLREFGWGTFALGPIIGAVVGFNLYNLLFVKTELAEVEEAKAENMQLNASITNSVVAADIDGRNRTAVAKAKTAVVKKNVAASKKKPTSAKRPATTKAKNPRRRNPNAV